MVAEPVEIGDAELVHHLDEAPAALVVAGGERVDVALDLQRLAHIGAHDAHQILVHAAGAGQRHQRDRQPSSNTWRPSGPMPSPPISTTCTVLANRPTGGRAERSG